MSVCYGEVPGSMAHNGEGERWESHLRPAQLFWEKLMSSGQGGDNSQYDTNRSVSEGTRL